ncbi:transposase InsO family protein [Deinococcus enclensis]|uniref:Transposase InsO family protein n=1 Tax=Deinococcus enclensis TaxID=1049582 RepID=A0ABT9MIW5_9DEIO|nr:transposase InsO family protein [Deinococcus enclensis]
MPEIVGNQRFDHSITLVQPNCPQPLNPEKPVQNAYIESEGGRMGDEFLNVHWFLSVPQTRLSLTIWRRDDSVVRKHSSLGNVTPQEFTRQLAG